MLKVAVEYWVASVFALPVIFASRSVGAVGYSLDESPKAEEELLHKAASNSFEEMLKNGIFSADLRLFYMTRTFDHVKPDTRALTGGGILKYESGVFHRFKFAFAYYGSHRIGGVFRRTEGAGTSLLQGNGNDIHFPGEAYLQYGIAKTTLKAGRQRLATPLMNDNNQRLVPSAYESAIFSNRDIPDSTIEAGYVTAYSGFGSRFSGFETQDTTWGKDGLGYIYFKNSSINNLLVRGQYIKAISDSDNSGATIKIDDYKYMDLKYDLPIGKNSYFKAQFGGNTYNSAPDSTLLGAKIGTTLFAKAEFALMYDKISGNNFEAVNASPMYTDFQQGYGLYEPSSAFGLQLTIKPVKDLSVKLAYANVSSDTKERVDDFSEYILDLKYIINHRSEFRIRASLKDQSNASESLLARNAGGREDRSDLRIIYNIAF